MWFKTLLELRINLDQSELALVEKVDDLKELAQELGCKFGFDCLELSFNDRETRTNRCSLIESLRNDYSLFK